MKAAVKPLGLSRAALAAFALAAAGCGELDDVTTIKDLRVLAVRAEPAGFLVPPDDAASLPATEATLTALVVDPKGEAATLSFSTEACPDYIDTVTSASGKGSKLCPTADATNALPPPLDTLLATTMLPAGTAAPLADSPIEYNPTAKFGVPAADLQTFFSLDVKTDPVTHMPDPVLASPVFRRGVQYNRDFGMDAIVGFTFTLGAEKATALKRVVYWPVLPPEATATIRRKTDDTQDRQDCPPGDAQVVNHNPQLTGVDLYRHRVEGVPMDTFAAPTPTLSIAAKDELYVQPVYDPASVEKYFLRVNDVEGGRIVTECHHELLTFQFYATAGTFSPEDRRSEPPPLLDRDSPVHTDSQYHLPKPADLPADGKVTLWVVVRDERAGESWRSRTILVTP
jgi:hypothetical protein